MGQKHGSVIAGTVLGPAGSLGSQVSTSNWVQRSSRKPGPQEPPSARVCWDARFTKAHMDPEAWINRSCLGLQEPAQKEPPMAAGICLVLG